MPESLCVVGLDLVILRHDFRIWATNKKGVVWHNDAGEKDETVFTPFIGTQGLKSPLFCEEFSGKKAS